MVVSTFWKMKRLPSPKKTSRSSLRSNLTPPPLSHSRCPTVSTTWSLKSPQATVALNINQSLSTMLWDSYSKPSLKWIQRRPHWPQMIRCISFCWGNRSCREVYRIRPDVDWMRWKRVASRVKIWGKAFRYRRECRIGWVWRLVRRSMQASIQGPYWSNRITWVVGWSSRWVWISGRRLTSWRKWQGSRG